MSQAVYIDGSPHITRRAVGEWLEYSDPITSIGRVIERNSHIEEYSVPVNLAGSDGKNYDTRVYHPIGFMLIVMESGQPKAKRMKAAVASFVWHFAGPQQLKLKEVMQLRNQQINILAKLDRCSNLFSRQGLVSALRDVSLRLGSHVPDVLLLNNTDPNQPQLPGV